MRDLESVHMLVALRGVVESGYRFNEVLRGDRSRLQDWLPFHTCIALGELCYITEHKYHGRKYDRCPSPYHLFITFQIQVICCCSFVSMTDFLVSMVSMSGMAFQLLPDVLLHNKTKPRRTLMRRKATIEIKPCPVRRRQTHEQEKQKQDCQ